MTTFVYQQLTFTRIVKEY